MTRTDDAVCRRCDTSTILSVIGGDDDHTMTELIKAKQMACRCPDDCGAAYCGGSDQRVASRAKRPTSAPVDRAA